MTLQWTDALTLGVPEIDAQHQELFRRVERLVDAVGRGDHSEVGPLLAFLHEYAVTHFGAEEALMREARYPGLRVHRAEHAKFVESLAALERDHAAEGATTALVHRLERQVCDWLRDHVYLTDGALGRYLRGPP